MNCLIRVFVFSCVKTVGINANTLLLVLWIIQTIVKYEKDVVIHWLKYVQLK